MIAACSFMPMFSVKSQKMINPSRLALLSLLICGHISGVMAQSPDTSSANSSAVAPGFSASQLNLPRSYQQHYSALQNAAQLASQSSRCVRFLRGELQRDRSSLSHPVFRILCRDDSGKSYALLVDGLTLRLLDETRPQGSISFAELEQESEQQRLAEERQKRELLELHNTHEFQQQVRERYQRVWEQCRERVGLRVGNMHELRWISDEMPEPELEADDKVIFYIDFDAADLYGQSLKYRAMCSNSMEDEYQILIRPRASFLSPPVKDSVDDDNA